MEPSPVKMESDESVVPAETVKGRLLQRLQRTYNESLAYVLTSPKPLWAAVRRILGYLERFVHPTETLLRRLPTAEEVEIVYPEGVSQRFIERRWRKFLHGAYLKHGRGIVLNSLLLPVTAAATLIPGPNVFVGWNGFRLYAHIMARRGAGFALDGRVRLKFRIDPRLKKREGDETPVSAAQAEDLQETLRLEGLVEYLRRMRCLSDLT